MKKSPNAPKAMLPPDLFISGQVLYCLLMQMLHPRFFYPDQHPCLKLITPEIREVGTRIAKYAEKLSSRSAATPARKKTGSDLPPFGAPTYAEVAYFFKKRIFRELSQMNAEAGEQEAGVQLAGCTAPQWLVWFKNRWEFSYGDAVRAGKVASKKDFAIDAAEQLGSEMFLLAEQNEKEATLRHRFEVIRRVLVDHRGRDPLFVKLAMDGNATVVAAAAELHLTIYDFRNRRKKLWIEVADIWDGHFFPLFERQFGVCVRK